MTTTLPMKRSLAVTVVNAYYEIKNEGNNQKNEEQFKKNFVKFIQLEKYSQFKTTLDMYNHALNKSNYTDICTYSEGIKILNFIKK